MSFLVTRKYTEWRSQGQIRSFLWVKTTHSDYARERTPAVPSRCAPAFSLLCAPVHTTVRTGPGLREHLFSVALIVTASVLLLICALLVHFYLFREHDVQSLVDRREREYRTGQAALRQGCMQAVSVYGLSERESDVLRRWAMGETASEIGNELCISQNTVRTHVRHIYEKTLTRDRDGLIDLIRAL